jgi:hypothetical protein
MNAPTEKLDEIGDSVVSLKVEGKKPRNELAVT